MFNIKREILKIKKKKDKVESLETSQLALANYPQLELSLLYLKKYNAKEFH